MKLLPFRSIVVYVIALAAIFLSSSVDYGGKEVNYKKCFYCVCSHFFGLHVKT